MFPAFKTRRSLLTGIVSRRFVALVATASLLAVGSGLIGTSLAAGPSRKKPLRQMQRRYSTIQSDQAATEAQPTPATRLRAAAPGPRPDLRIRDVRFVPANPKQVYVVVGNAGPGAAGASKLRLTIRRINGIPVARKVEVLTPALASAQSATLLIDAASILPVAVKLKATTFRLDAAVSKVVYESNETNNLRWHNL